MADAAPKNLLARFADDVGERLSSPVRVLTVVTSVGLITLAGYVLIKVLSGGWSILQNLRDQDYARGLITLSITFVTLTLAVVLVLTVLARTMDETRFRPAREIFGVLAGILGTIVGFYFGSADKQGQRMKILSMRLQPGQVRAMITGGKPPYRYDLAVGSAKKVESKQSEDGYVEEAIADAKAGAVVKLGVRDSAAPSAVDEVEAKVPEGSTPSPSPPPAPPQS